MALLPLHVQWASLSSVFPSPCQVPPHCHSFLSWFGERVLAISVPVSPMGFPVLKTICFGGGGECGRDRVGRQDLGLLLASQVLESYSENQGGKKKKKSIEKPSGQSLSSCVLLSQTMVILSPHVCHSWTQSPQNWGETTSLGPRLPRVGMWAVLRQAQC